METISTTSEYAQDRPLVVWRDLPDPRDPVAVGTKVSIVVNSAAWEEHVVRHVVNRGEPWDSLLDTATAETLRKAHAAGTAVPPQILQQALARLELEIRRSLERPLAMLYGVHRLGSSGKKRPARLAAAASLWGNGLRPSGRMGGWWWGGISGNLLLSMAGGRRT